MLDGMETLGCAVLYEDRSQGLAKSDEVRRDGLCGAAAAVASWVRSIASSASHSPKFSCVTSPDPGSTDNYPPMLFSSCLTVKPDLNLMHDKRPMDLLGTAFSASGFAQSCAARMMLCIRWCFALPPSVLRAPLAAVIGYNYANPLTPAVSHLTWNGTSAGSSSAAPPVLDIHGLYSGMNRHSEGVLT